MRLPERGEVSGPRATARNARPTPVRTAWRAEHRADPPDARLAEVHLGSPKLKGDWTTARFAEKVEHRYEDCLARR